MDFMEAVLISMGLDIQTLVDNGWRDSQISAAGNISKKTPVLSIHFIQQRAEAIEAVVDANSTVRPSCNPPIEITITDKLSGGTILDSTVSNMIIIGPGLYHAAVSIPLPTIPPSFGARPRD